MAANSNHDAIDVAKFLMSLAVVAIHCNLFYGSPLQLLIWPWVRVSVPLFFMISGYFYFKDQHRYSVFFMRIAALYLIWFVLTLGATVHSAVWWLQGENVVICVVRFLSSLLFGGTFGASWYLAALLWGILIVDLFLRKLSSRWFYVIVLTLFVFCTWSSLCNFKIYGMRPHRSFFIGVVWVALGYAFASGKLAWVGRWTKQGFPLKVCAIGGGGGALA